MKVYSPENLTSSFNLVFSIRSQYKSKLGLIDRMYNYSPHTFVKGGRKEALKVLSANLPNLANYKAVRQIPLMRKNTSSHMSAYNKYGCVSIRELYKRIVELYDSEHELIRQIVWRDFYYNLVYNYPETFEGNHSYINTYEWSNNKSDFEKWCSGNTGFPFVDAGMRQLNKEGYMPNRFRLVCASFLIKNLHIDRRWGEKYFARRLVDYDPSQNNGNWQWVSSTGYESQAYYRFINPITDLTKFDIECIYVKKI